VNRGSRRHRFTMSLPPARENQPSDKIRLARACGRCLRQKRRRHLPSQGYPFRGGSEQVYDGVDMSLASPAYFEIIDFIAGGTTPEAVAHFRPSPEDRQRVAELIERQRAAVLSPEEQAELDHFMELEHILRMAKARAHQILSGG
jgi:hypothetical protein